MLRGSSSCLQFVIVLFPDHTHLPFLLINHFAIADSLFIVAPIVFGGSVFVSCFRMHFRMQYVVFFLVLQSFG